MDRITQLEKECNEWKTKADARWNEGVAQSLRIQELVQSIQSALEILGEEGKCDTHNCPGCAYEHDAAVRLLKQVLENPPPPGK